MIIPLASSRRRSRALADPDGRAVPIVRACAVPGCVIGRYLDPAGEADHQARAGHWPAPGRPLCPLLAVGTA
jgi:hypothetical protein